MPFVDLAEVDMAVAVLANTTGEQTIRQLAAQGSADLTRLQNRVKQRSSKIDFTYIDEIDYSTLDFVGET